MPASVGSPIDTETPTYIGAMTGTSLDGLDLALLTIDQQADDGSTLNISHGQTVALPEPLQQALTALTNPGVNEIDRMGEADRLLGLFIGESINAYLQSLGRSASSIRAIGSHGQTIRHRPTGTAPFTLQIGDPNCIAESTGICTVADFRRRDMAAGGQGAPLVPLFHEALFGSLFAATRSGPDNGGSALGVLNIGGISNLSVMTDSAGISGFDTGPGNGLLDAWIRRHQGQPFDAGGQWAASAQSDGTLLEELLSDPFFKQPPPRSTGREYFNVEWLQRNPRVATLDPAQIQATLAELTARSVSDAIREYAPSLEQLLVCGGGRHNGFLMQRLSDLSGLQVESTDVYGVDGDSLEAAAFGWLAHRTLEALPGNAPAVTGAAGPRVLGGVYFGSQLS